jgi:hypothetical protein
MGMERTITDEDGSIAFLGWTVISIIHVGFDVDDDCLQLGRQYLDVIPLLVNQTVGSMLTMLCCATKMLVDSTPKTSFRDSLMLLSLRSTLPLCLTLRCCSSTTYFLIHKLHAQLCFSALAEQVTETF